MKLPALASGNTKKHVPFGALGVHQRQFIESKYLPNGFTFEDPRNLKKGQILEFFKHVRERQESHGPSEAFRFLKYVKGRELVSAEYGTRLDEECAATKTAKARSAHANVKATTKGNGKSKGRGKGKAKETETADADDMDGGIPFDHRQTPNSKSSITQRPGSLTIPIDPVLLAMQSLMPPRGAGNVPAAISMPPRDQGNISPTISIDESDMAVLTSLGHQAILPVNGPNDGPPMYSITASAHQMLHQHKLNLSEHGQNAGQTQSPPLTLPIWPRPQPRPLKKTQANATAGAAINAAAVLDASMATNAAPTPEHDDEVNNDIPNQQPPAQQLKNRSGPHIERAKRNADATAMQEAAALLKKSGLTRSKRDSRQK